MKNLKFEVIEKSINFPLYCSPTRIHWARRYQENKVDKMDKVPNIRGDYIITVSGQITRRGGYDSDDSDDFMRNFKGKACTHVPPSASSSPSPMIAFFRTKMDDTCTGRIRACTRSLDLGWDFDGTPDSILVFTKLDVLDSTGKWVPIDPSDEMADYDVVWFVYCVHSIYEKANLLIGFFMAYLNSLNLYLFRDWFFITIIYGIFW